MEPTPARSTRIHRFEHAGRRFAIDAETCFCFECDAISWDVLEHYPALPINRIYRLLEDRYDRKELEEVVGELEWLRATKSILSVRKPDEQAKAFEVERGVRRVTLILPKETAASAPGLSWLRFGARSSPLDVSNMQNRRALLLQDAVRLLLGRSQNQNELSLELVERQGIDDPREVASLCLDVLKSGRLAGKKLTIGVRVDDVTLAKLPESLAVHSLAAVLEFSGAEHRDILSCVETLAGAVSGTLAHLAKALTPEAPGVNGRIVVRPGKAEFQDVARILDEAGFSAIELDVDGAFVAHPSLDPKVVLKSLDDTAVYYAQRLLSQRYFRLAPFASVFWRIYNGKPHPRTDPAGTNELVVDESGNVFASRGLMEATAKNDAFCLGSVSGGALDEDRICRYEDVGAWTTSACLKCWARNLCGGGTVGVHHALTGSFRTPHQPWCDMQRAWLAASVSAFQQLSSQGVHFDRVYKSLGRRVEKPSLFALARAAFTMSVGVRPIEEADAKMLVLWENWNEASYFTCHESGVLLGSIHERETDSLHPRGTEQELVLIRKTGEPMGLFKVRADTMPGVARAWLYFRNASDYASDSIRRGFRAVLDEASRQQSIKRLVIAVRQEETDLQAFLEAIGFTKAGVQREALYLHGRYHDALTYRLALN